MIPVVRRVNWLPNVFNDFYGKEWMDRTRMSSPAVNIKESEKEFTVEIAAPGLTKDDFNLEILEDDQLFISMEKKTDNKEEEKEDKYLRREFSYMSFKQRLILPDNIDKEKIEAKMENGVLSIGIPKEEEKVSAPKKIQIN